MVKNIFLADIVFVFHCIIVAFMILAPFTNIPAILVLHITSALCLITHWYFNSDVCSLSVLEANLRGLDRTHTFTHQFISPVYNITFTDWSTIVWITTSALLCVSMYKLYNSAKFESAFKCYKDKLTDDLLFKDKVSLFFSCFSVLFIV